MKKTIYILYVLLIFAVVGCVNDLDMTPIGEETVDVTVPEEDGDGVYGNAPVVDFGDALTRSTLTFDYNTRTLLFSWVMGDLVGVFPDREDNHKSQIVYTVNEMISAHRARFTQKDNAVSPEIKTGNLFVSYKPATENYEGKSTEIPFSFANQYQENPVNMKSYWDSLQVSSIGEGKYYKESEKMASIHLPEYDFQVSAGAAPRDNHLVFDYTRLSSFVRLYLKVKEEATYDSIIILNKDADFFIDGTMDISKNVSSEAFTPKTKLHYVTLRLGEKTTDENGVTKYAGFSIWNDNLTQINEKKCALWSAEKEAGYIVAYMAFVPIQLKNLANGCTLYLLGHDNSGNKKYYRAKTTLSKYNLEQNKIQQWAPSENSVDDPIEVIPVEVEEWKADMEFSNEGTGTEEW
ncbi:MAG: hypothetical protein PUD87_03185 [Prevotellaceae bacterium]|nr:hypothetical protein [Prevotellaceae bacterium]